MARDLSKTTLHGKTGGGSFSVTTWEQEGHAIGGPMFLFGPGWCDESGRTRVPAAKEVARRGFRVGVISHGGRTSLKAIMHPREQRSRDIESAVGLAEETYHPEVVILDGHSFGGPNANDAVNHRLEALAELGRTSGTKLVVVHEAAPGLGENPFDHDELDMRTEIREALHHLGAVGVLALHEAKPRHVAERILGLATAVGEARSLIGIHIQPGADVLAGSGVDIHNLYYESDGIVPIPDDMRDAPGTTILSGCHLSSYFSPVPFAEYLTDGVLSEVS